MTIVTYILFHFDFEKIGTEHLDLIFFDLFLFSLVVDWCNTPHRHQSNKENRLECDRIR